MNIKKFVCINFIITVLFLANINAFSKDSQFSSPTDTVLQIREVEVIDSVIFKMLDSVIAYAEYCHGLHRRLITHYIIQPRYRKRYNDIKFAYSLRHFAAYSITDAALTHLDRDKELFFLEYKDNYFIFNNISDSSIKDMEIYLKPTSKIGELFVFREERREGYREYDARPTIITGGVIDSKKIRIREKRLTPYGKTYIMLSGEIKDNSVFIKSRQCRCSFNRLIRTSKLGGIRLFIYRLFCPFRASRWF